MHFIRSKNKQRQLASEDTLHFTLNIQKEALDNPSRSIGLLQNLSTAIENSKKIPDDKKAILNKYFEDLHKPPKYKANDTDFNILFETYYLAKAFSI